MAKGRKMKPDAQRRGGTQPRALAAAAAVPVMAEPVEPPKVQKPAHVAENVVQSACWDSLVGNSPNFEPCDVPLLEAYCYWYSVLRQAEMQTITEDGLVVTMLGQHNADGELMKTVAHPDIRTAEKATNMLRQLGDVLNMTPSARGRSGLLNAMTQATQADVVRKTLEGFAEFKRRQEESNAAE